jgi:hypothetical protein
MHEDIGYGTSKDSNQGSALEKARKAAITDGRKRALRCFGELLGNSLKHKDDHTKALTENLGNECHSPTRVSHEICKHIFSFSQSWILSLLLLLFQSFIIDHTANFIKPSCCASKCS